MRTTRRNRLGRVCAGVLLAGTALLTSAGAALADDPSASASPADDEGAGPTEAGTTFRTATPVQQEQTATAEASTGDYLYWVFPADAGERATVRAKVTLPESATRHGASTWQVDVYDGLRRRQACMYGHQTRKAAPDANTVELSCVLRTVRAWSEPWANDPLPGSYYVRLTVVDLAEEDLGLPVRAEARVTSVDKGGSHDVDGTLSEPLVPGASSVAQAVSGDSGDDERPKAAPGSEPEDGWTSGWWTDRWLWTVGGGVLAALAAVFGYNLTRGRGRPSHVPPGF
ncbi:MULTISPECIES: hypothetical protein [unclassified Streptomyces]|uniref:hypothetical protein n=1 Tax=unclassified Streptomyces TaxID=2593676 RepID=UPI0001C1BB24|nr:MULTISPECIES: hypothetical protein [unclassified Streptomyces]AEN13610.1 conserved hypothetical protein [Streptomyces sp. SirexAA-E]MYR64649.1 hypothetical protein [Streptomyces sp. SID4939]MYS03725.1 hypothetical protein [Streptomyces sp. SID4940]MYT66940.1 hypothetical protein [Streptomyces sp. SID8357]MYT84584.1 hypothetical protein [Streptomyces sp. SID8360]